MSLGAGLDAGRSRVRLAEIKSKKGAIALTRYHSVPLDPGETPQDAAAAAFGAARPKVGPGRVGPTGSGHFTKMIHNGIEYGMMQAFAEGFAILKKKSEFDLDLHQISEIWRHGSVVRSWLLDLTAAALKEDQELEAIAPYVSDSGEGRWTVAEAIELDVPAPVITHSLISRLRSRDEESYADRMLSAMRNQFGGHAIKKS